jgi:hypothetical protein
LGRRRSVAGATSRRCPSARMRPGAGYLPTLALGRPRGLPAGVSRMTLLRTSPRPVYRVYSEEEFLAAEERSEPVATEPVEAELRFASPGDGEPFFASPGDGEPFFAPPGDGEPRLWGRIAALAALAAAVVVVVGVVAMNEMRSRVATERRLADRRDAPEPAREDPATGPSPTDRGPSSGGIGHGRRLRPVSTTVRRAAEHHALFAPAPPSAPAAHTRVPPRSRAAATAALSMPASASAVTNTTVARSPAPASRVAASPVAASPVAAAPARTATVAATATIADRSGREFGFER